MGKTVEIAEPVPGEAKVSSSLLAMTKVTKDASHYII